MFEVGQTYPTRSGKLSKVVYALENGRFLCVGQGIHGNEIYYAVKSNGVMGDPNNCHHDLIAPDPTEDFFV